MKYSLRSLFALITVIAVLLAVWSWWDYFPGTFRRDANGFPHGTGVESEYYKSGQLKSSYWHRAGVPTGAKWYRPDGTVIEEITFDIHKASDNLILREDGSVEWRIPFVFDPIKRDYFAHGTAYKFDKSGNITETAEYRHGEKVKN